MRNPCLTCIHRRCDKNCETCFNCKKRIEYLQTEFNDGLASKPFLLDSYNQNNHQANNKKHLDESALIHKTLCLASNKYKISIDKICANDYKDLISYKKSVPARIFVTARLYNIISTSRIANILNTSERSIYSYRNKAIQSGLLKDKGITQPTKSVRKDFSDQAPLVVKTIHQICEKHGYTQDILLNNTKSDPSLRKIRSIICMKLHGTPFYMTPIEISKIIGLHKTTVRTYLHEAKDEGKI